MMEVERKFRIKDDQSLVERLVKSGFKKSDTIHQVDKVFLTKSDSFKGFQVGDPVTRIRRNNESILLTYKRASGTDSGIRIEHEMEVSSYATAEGFLLEMGYKPVVTIDKIRIEYKRDNTTITIDKVKSLGLFSEIEILCEPEQEAKAQKQIMDTALELGLDLKDIETKHYDQLVSETI